MEETHISLQGGGTCGTKLYMRFPVEVLICIILPGEVAHVPSRGEGMLLVVFSLQEGMEAVNMLKGFPREALMHISPPGEAFSHFPARGGHVRS